MTAPLAALKPAEVARRLKQGCIVLVDIREPDEFARRRIPGAVSRPLSTLERAGLEIEPGAEVVFACRMGGRTSANGDRLAAAADGPVYVLEGGVDGWAAAGLAIVADRRAPLEIMRQVQLIAGSLVLAGVALGLWVHPAFLGLAAFVGAGLIFAGASGFCGMARLLALMPWNRARALKPAPAVPS